MYLNNVLVSGLLPLLATLIHASPLSEENLVKRALPEVECAKVTKVISVLKSNKATSFCSSYLGIKTSTSTITKVQTSTITSAVGTPSTTVVFLPGNPPASKERRGEAALDEARIEQRDNKPDYLKDVGSPVISSACKCLNLPTPVSTTTKVSVQTTIITVRPTVTKTVYPCATPVPGEGANKVQTVPYGLAYPYPSSVPGTSNQRFDLSTKGGTLEGCCNICYFDIPNCLQAFYYSYQGCVVQQPTEIVGTGPGVSSVCPNGQIAGLTYNRDTNPPFRSTGNIAGPCGQTYNNL
ncbi:MAG: hypothetical protein LQ349_000270 [Xanthoria aureola]|nr:MAG: hypothetical protein LQ349_000270 [Xanthoria aureola]